MRHVRASSGRRAAAVAADVTAVADTVGGVKVASEEAIRFRKPRPQGKHGQGWIRTSEGVKPADLQSAPFGHFGTYPSLQAQNASCPPPGGLVVANPAQADANCRSLLKKINDRVYHKLLRFARNFRIHWQCQ